MTTAANVLFNCYLSDLETCFKLVPRDLYLRLDIRSAGFGMEAEITGKLLRRRIWPCEVPISCKAGSGGACKKLTWRDRVAELGIMMRERVRQVVG